MENAERFLNVYAQIENFLRTNYGYDKEIGFSTVINKVANTNSIVRNKKDDLRQYHDLRNAIVHNRRDGEPIADPFVGTVENLEKIAELIIDPPKVYPAFGKEVTTLSDKSPITEAVSLMHEHSFSQIPITDENQNFVDLLTANTITRWLGANVDIGMVDLEDEEISDILTYKEEFNRHRFVARNTNLAEVLEIFEEAKESEILINAILITQNGKETERLLGIVTHYDLPEIYRCL